MSALSSSSPPLLILWTWKPGECLFPSQQHKLLSLLKGNGHQSPFHEADSFLSSAWCLSFEELLAVQKRSAKVFDLTWPCRRLKCVSTCEEIWVRTEQRGGWENRLRGQKERVNVPANAAGQLSNVFSHRSWGWRLHQRYWCPCTSREKAGFLCSLPSEDAVRLWRSATCRRAPSRSRPRCHPDLRPPSSRTVRNKFTLCRSTQFVVIGYSSPNWLYDIW